MRIAGYWMREEAQREILLLTNGEIVDAQELRDDPERQVAYGENGVEVANSRTVPSWQVTHTLMSGTDILEETKTWPCRWIPIIPVYGEDITVDGKRHLRSMIVDAKDPIRMNNYWRSAATEMVALSPRAPWIMAKGAAINPEEWARANEENVAMLEYDPQKGPNPPQRQAFDASPVGAMQQALAANDDIKSVLGQHDASLGARSNETSGRAIIARQREGDVSQYHFTDNLGSGHPARRPHPTGPHTSSLQHSESCPCAWA